MNIIIECTNFKPSAALNTFIHEKSEGILKLDAKITRLEFTLSVERDDHAKSFACGLNVNIPGNDITVHRNAEEAHDVVLKAVDSAKRSLRKVKTKRLAARRKVASKVSMLED